VAGEGDGNNGGEGGSGRARANECRSSAASVPGAEWQRLHFTSPPLPLKTDKELRDAARAADEHLAAGLPGPGPHASLGVRASSAFDKLPDFQPSCMRGLDPMHLFGNVSRALFLMGKGNAYTPAALKKMAPLEVLVNGRWRDRLDAHLSTAPPPVSGGAAGCPPADTQRPPWEADFKSTFTALNSASHLSYFGKAHAYSEWRDYVSDTPSFLKTYDWLMLSGPLGKYALHGTGMAPDVYNACCALLDAMSRAWRKRARKADLPGLRTEIARALVAFEVACPAWELDKVFHILVHVPDRIAWFGPLWACSMFPFERLWGRLLRWKFQRSRTEASLMLRCRLLSLCHGRNATK
jgi:hypothetical protein